MLGVIPPNPDSKQQKPFHVLQVANLLAGAQTGTGKPQALP